ncbi:MBL fold metallo-hydrolase [Streptomyces sp. NPDC052016]|uniref:MBL fold metallo-hydrolase n=1 Tax=unclassified Streptomyces TaxID=2593676 RepID=UPI003444C9DE
MEIYPLGVWALSTLGETSSFMVDTGTSRLMMDVGLNPGYSLTKHSVPLTTITHIFLSHCHSDHMQGFANLVFTRDAQQRLHGPAPALRVMASTEDLARAQSLLRIFYPERTFPIEWVPVEPGAAVELGTYALEFFPTHHTVTGLGLVMKNTEENTKLLVYSSDTAPCEALREAATTAHTLIGECFGTRSDFGPIAERLKHMCAEDLAEVAAEANARRVIPFHLQAPYASDDRRSELINVIRSTFSGEVLDPVPSRPIGLAFD